MNKSNTASVVSTSVNVTLSSDSSKLTIDLPNGDAYDLIADYDGRTIVAVANADLTEIRAYDGLCACAWHRHNSIVRYDEVMSKSLTSNVSGAPFPIEVLQTFCLSSPDVYNVIKPEESEMKEKELRIRNVFATEAGIAIELNDGEVLALHSTVDFTSDQNIAVIEGNVIRIFVNSELTVWTLKDGDMTYDKAATVELTRVATGNGANVSPDIEDVVFSMDNYGGKFEEIRIKEKQKVTATGDGYGALVRTAKDMFTPCISEVNVQHVERKSNTLYVTLSNGIPLLVPGGHHLCGEWSYAVNANCVAVFTNQQVKVYRVENGNDIVLNPELSKTLEAVLTCWNENYGVPSMETIEGTEKQIREIVQHEECPVTFTRLDSEWEVPAVDDVSKLYPEEATEYNHHMSQKQEESKAVLKEAVVIVAVTAMDKGFRAILSNDEEVFTHMGVDMRRPFCRLHIKDGDLYVGINNLWSVWTVGPNNKSVEIDSEATSTIRRDDIELKKINDMPVINRTEEVTEPAPKVAETKEEAVSAIDKLTARVATGCFTGDEYEAAKAPATDIFTRCQRDQENLYLTVIGAEPKKTAVRSLIGLPSSGLWRAMATEKHVIVFSTTEIVVLRAEGKEIYLDAERTEHAKIIHDSINKLGLTKYVLNSIMRTVALGYQGAFEVPMVSNTEARVKAAYPAATIDVSASNRKPPVVPARTMECKVPKDELFSDDLTDSWLALLISDLTGPAEKEQLGNGKCDGKSTPTHRFANIGTREFKGWPASAQGTSIETNINPTKADEGYNWTVKLSLPKCLTMDIIKEKALVEEPLTITVGSNSVTVNGPCTINLPKPAKINVSNTEKKAALERAKNDPWFYFSEMLKAPAEKVKADDRNAVYKAILDSISERRAFKAALKEKETNSSLTGACRACCKASKSSPTEVKVDRQTWLRTGMIIAGMDYYAYTPAPAKPAQPAACKMDVAVYGNSLKSIATCNLIARRPKERSLKSDPFTYGVDYTGVMAMLEASQSALRKQDVTPCQDATTIFMRLWNRRHG